MILKKNIPLHKMLLDMESFIEQCDQFTLSSIRLTQRANKLPKLGWTVRFKEIKCVPGSCQEVHKLGVLTG